MLKKRWQLVNSENKKKGRWEASEREGIFFDRRSNHGLNEDLNKFYFFFEIEAMYYKGGGSSEALNKQLEQNGMWNVKLKNLITNLPKRRVLIISTTINTSPATTTIPLQAPLSLHVKSIYIYYIMYI